MTSISRLPDGRHLVQLYQQYGITPDANTYGAQHALVRVPGRKCACPVGLLAFAAGVDVFNVYAEVEHNTVALHLHVDHNTVASYEAGVLAAEEGAERDANLEAMSALNHDAYYAGYDAWKHVMEVYGIRSALDERTLEEMCDAN